MELFLSVTTVVFLFFIGAGTFSLLYAVARRTERKVLLANKESGEDTGENTGEESGEDTREDTDKNESTGPGESAADAVAGEKAPEEADDETDGDGADEPVEWNGPDFGKDYICESCGAVLGAADVFPIVSFLYLKGECRYCGDKIPRIELISELFGALLFEFLFFRFGGKAVTYSLPPLRSVLDITATSNIFGILGLILIFVIFSLMFLISVVDAKTMEIPLPFTLSMLAAGATSIFLFQGVSLKEHLIGMVAISLPMLIITLLIPGAFGGGDIKLMFGAGLLLGWKLALVATFIGIVTGGIYAVLLLVRKKAGRKAHFAFGPFLCLGIGTALICGNTIIRLYLEMGRTLYG